MGTVCAAVLPKLLLAVRGAGYAARDRGIRKLNFPAGSAVVYEPSSAFSFALEQYLVARIGEDAVFLGKWKKDVLYCEYDLYVYDRSRRIIGILNVRELPKNGRGEQIALPKDTGSVSPALRAVNETALPRSEKNFRRSLPAMIATALFLTLLLSLQALLFEICFFRLLSGEGSLLPEGGAGFVSLMTFLSAATVSVTVFLLFCLKRAAAGLRRLGGGISKGGAATLSRLVSRTKNLFYSVRNLFVLFYTSRFMLALRRKTGRAAERLRALFHKKKRAGSEE